MNIALVSLTMPLPARPDGAEGAGRDVTIVALADALSAAGNAVTVFMLRADPAPSPRRVTAEGSLIEIVDYGPAPRTSADVVEAVQARLLTALRAARPDVIHVQSMLAGKAASAAANALGVPLVQTFWGAKMFGPGDGAAMLRSAARIIATSSTQVFELLELGAHPRAIKLIPRGVDVRRYRAAIDPAPRPDGIFRVAVLSTLAPEAGVADVIEALALLDGVELTIGVAPGSADPAAGIAALEALAAARGVRDRLVCRPVPHAETAAFLREADLVVCVPWQDSTDTVVLEAMACGLPVIASGVGIHLDAVADGISGIHVPPRAPRQLAYAIASLKADGPKRERFSRLGIERAARYAWTRIAADLVEVYRGISASGLHVRPAGVVV